MPARAMVRTFLGPILALLLGACSAAGGPAGSGDGADGTDDGDATDGDGTGDGGGADAGGGSVDAGDGPGPADAAPVVDSGSGPPPPDAAPQPACVTDADCGGYPHGCLAGVCRDRCIPLLQPCDWKPSGNVCTASGYCVECQKDSDCPGTRYRCDTASMRCVDQPFDASITKIGIFYHTWHCPSAAQVHDITKCLAGQTPWPPWPADPNTQTSFWWGEPAAGYYCLTGNTQLLTQHAVQLRDLGVDFVFVDVTNHNYNTSTLNVQPEAMIVQPFTTLVNVWKTVPGAPKIVPWVPVSDCPTYLPASSCNQPSSKYMVYTLLDLLAGSGMAFQYQGKPLLLVTENDTYPVSAAKLAALAAGYTVRKMWAFEPDGSEKWSYLERCDASPLEGRPCGQRFARKAGAQEQLAITTAYGADYMSHTSTATPKHHGKTFRKQFQTLFDNPEVPIVTITGWNEWIVGRWPCGSPACPCSNSFDATYGCFLDQYTDEYNRDIEPAKTPTGDYYYRLTQACIQLFRAGGRCTPDNAGHLCCKDYTP